MPSFLGLYIRPGWIEFSEAENSENGRFVAARAFEVDPQIGFTEEILKILKDKSFGLKKSYEGISFSLSSGNDIYRKMSFPFAKEQVEKTIRFEFFDQIKDTVNGKVDEYFFDYQLLNSSDQRTTAMGVCCHEKDIQNLVLGLEKLDLDPEKITPELTAVTTFVRSRIPFVASGNAMILHTTPEDVSFLILKQGQIFELRQLKIKLGDIRALKAVVAKEESSNTNVLSNRKAVESEFEEEEDFFKIASFTNQEIEDIKNQKAEVAPEGVIEPSELKKHALKRLLIQLQRTLFLVQDNPGEMVITGTYSRDKELIDAINAYGLRVFEADSSVDLEHAASLGAVQTFFEKDQVPLNFRQGKLEYKGFFEKVVTPLIICMSLLLGITLVMNYFLIQKEKVIVKEINTYLQHSIKIAKDVDGSNEKFKKATKINQIEPEMLKLKKLLDFQANVNEYEKKYPIISCLKVWLEYEKNRNSAMQKKIAVAGEQNMAISQTSTGVRMDVTNARTAGFEEATNFIKNFGALKYFDIHEDKMMRNDPAKNDVVFDFYVHKNY